MGTPHERERTKVRKGIIFAFDPQRQLDPMTQAVARCLLPIYDKPMVYYPLSTLMLAGIREIMVVTGNKDAVNFMKLLGNGSRLGVSISYATQPAEVSWAESLPVAERFLEGDPVCIIRGDSVFYGELPFLRRAMELREGATIFVRRTKHPPPHASMEFDADGTRPRLLQNNGQASRPFYAIAGLYLYDEKVLEISKRLKASGSAELTMNDLNREYLNRGELCVQKLPRNIAWLEAATAKNILKASILVAKTEKRRRTKMGCIEEVAFRMGFIDAPRLHRLTCDLPPNGYRQYLENLLQQASRERPAATADYASEGASAAVGAAR